MIIDFGAVRLLECREVREGERWLYSADFNSCKNYNGNVKPGTTSRIDEELDDLKQIVDAGGRVAILAHKGRYRDRDTVDLDFVKPYLAGMGLNVEYFGENSTRRAADFVLGMPNGSIAIMGNVRKNPGEESRPDTEDYRRLAELYSMLGEYVAVGGFGKAHRANASNVGVLEYRPGYLARSQRRQMEKLGEWAGRNEDTYSVAVLGGVKKEKITVGLKGFAEVYDAIIPGGIVLNTILAVSGYDIGDSVIDDGGKTFEKEVYEIMQRNGNKIHVPSVVIIARKKNMEDCDEIDISRTKKVPPGYMIVDFKLSDSALESLDKVVKQRGRLLIAGTPGLCKDMNFREATDNVVTYARMPEVKGLVLGGDTANDIGDCEGIVVSTGGGSALAFVTEGTTEVFEALKRNKKRFAYM